MTKLKSSVICVAGLVAFVLLTSVKGKIADEAIVWKLNDLAKVGKYTPDVLGKPAIVKDHDRTACLFNGVNDGLILPEIPVQGWPHFTIEVLFKPDADGPVAPRFVHFQDKDENRGTFEIRLTPQKQWYLDAFLKNGKTNEGLALNDSTLLHPAGRWYWVAMVYTGKKMTSYVNGVKEHEGDLDFPPIGAGQIALGVRLNKVNWFKGAISEIRFDPEILTAGALQKITE